MGALAPPGTFVRLTRNTVWPAGVTRTDRSGRGHELFRGRIMFPVTDPKGAVAGFTGRDTTGRTGAPKYLNTPANPAYRKAELLFGTTHLTGSITTLVLVEGPWDALAVTLATQVPASSGGAAAQAGHIEGLVDPLGCHPGGDQRVALRVGGLGAVGLGNPGVADSMPCPPVVLSSIRPSA